jgi:hypothetical protein
MFKGGYNPPIIPTPGIIKEVPLRVSQGKFSKKLGIPSKKVGDYSLRDMKIPQI